VFLVPLQYSTQASASSRVPVPKFRAKYGSTLFSLPSLSTLSQCMNSSVPRVPSTIYSCKSRIITKPYRIHSSRFPTTPALDELVCSLWVRHRRASGRWLRSCLLDTGSRGCRVHGELLGHPFGSRVRLRGGFPDRKCRRRYNGPYVWKYGQREVGGSHGNFVKKHGLIVKVVISITNHPRDL